MPSGNKITIYPEFRIMLLSIALITAIEIRDDTWGWWGSTVFWSIAFALMISWGVLVIWWAAVLIGWLRSGLASLHRIWTFLITLIILLLSLLGMQ